MIYMKKARTAILTIWITLGVTLLIVIALTDKCGWSRDAVTTSVMVYLYSSFPVILIQGILTYKIKKDK